MGRVESVLTGFALLFLLITTLSLVAPAGAMPVVFTSPISDSMTPTITQDDFLIVTSGDVEVGDAILFETSQHNRNVLHRIVDTTEDGQYITQGDANDLTDQQDGFEPVSDDDIYGSVLTLGGSTTVSVPIIGAILSNPTTVISMWVVISLIGFAPTIFGDNQRTSLSVPVERGASDRKIVIGVAVCTMLLLPVAILGTPVTEGATIITSESVSPEDNTQRTAAIGHSTTQKVVLTSDSLVGMTQSAHLEGDLRLEEVQSSPIRPETAVFVSNPPRESPTADIAQITLYAYPSTLPQSTLQTLANIHPVLAALASSGMIAFLLSASAFVFINPHRITRQKKATIYENRR
jgi:signal peptidase I